MESTTFDVTGRADPLPAAGKSATSARAGSQLDGLLVAERVHAKSVPQAAGANLVLDR